MAPNYEQRKCLEIYEWRKIESTFVKTINGTGNNFVLAAYTDDTNSPKELTNKMSSILTRGSKDRDPYIIYS